MQILRRIGYGAFFLASLLFSLYVTFPWGAAKDRILDFASRSSGFVITAESLEPSWFLGVRARALSITPPGAPQSIKIEEARASAHLLAFLTGKQGFSVTVPIAKGELDANVTIAADTVSVDGTASGIELAFVPGLVDALGLPLSGTTTLATDLTLSKKDPKQTKGKLTLKAGDLKLQKGGKVGGFSVPADLEIGNLDWTVPVADGKAVLTNARIEGPNVEAVLDGSVALLHPVARSTVNLTLSFKPTEKLLKAEPILGALLNNIQGAKGSDGFYSYQLTGNIKHPHFAPKRK